MTAKKAKKMGVVDMVIDPLGPGLAPAEETTMKYLESTAIMVAEKILANEIKIPARGQPKNFQVCLKS